jgi:hypothetical protein
MKHVAAIILIVLAGCDAAGGPEGAVARPQEINIPASLRQRNWGPRRNGSCTHAAVVTLLAWQNRPHTSARWRATHAGGETPESLAAKLSDVRFALSDPLDVTFLERAIETRRACGVAIDDGEHMVVLVSLDERAGFIDVNAPGHIQYMPRDQFLAQARWAITVVYSPLPPLPCSS